jgi:hypothetical protein
MVHIPIVSNIFGGRGDKIPVRQEIEPIRAMSSIPTFQPNHPPTIEVIREVSATEHIEPEWRKKYRGFDLKQIGYSNLPEGGDEVLRIEFSAYRDIQENFRLKDDVFDDDLEESRTGYLQDEVLVQNQGRKAIGGALQKQVLSATSINKTEIQAGQILKEDITKKGGFGSFFMR